MGKEVTYIMIQIYDKGGRLLCKLHYSGFVRSVSSALSDCSLRMDYPCAGQGKCGKCKIRIEGEISEPNEVEKRYLTEEELKTHIRLSCQTQILGAQVHIYLPDTSELIAELDQFNMNAEKGVTSSGIGLAVDIGTTTVAAGLWDMKSQTMIAVTGTANPQREYGADVISRLQASLQGKGKLLQKGIVQCIRSLIAELCEKVQCKAEVITCGVITGNTAMLYLLRGYSVKDIAAFPFEMKYGFGEMIPAKELGLQLDCQIYLPPCISAYIGADTVCGIVASGLRANEYPSVLMDVGTNGEMVIAAGGKLWCCAAAAGPAFEGVGISCGSPALAGAVDKVTICENRLVAHVIGEKQGTTICGSGLLDAVACLLKTGEIDESGRMTSQKVRIEETSVTLTQNDIRSFQLAKAAIRAGLDTLLIESGQTPQSIKQVFLAGGFGTKLPVDSATVVGLMPKSFASKAVPVGNAALAGASALLNPHNRKLAESVVSEAKTVDLSSNMNFQQFFLNDISFEEE